MNDDWQRARQLLIHLAPAQAASGCPCDGSDAHPVSRALADAPLEDEEISEEEERAFAEAREWLTHNDGIPFEQVVGDLGLTMEQVRKYRDPSSSNLSCPLGLGS